MTQETVYKLSGSTETTVADTKYEYDVGGLAAASNATTGLTAAMLADPTATIYVYDAMGEVAAEYGGTPAPVSGPSYVAVDTLGSSRAEVDSQGNVTRHDYLPFGQEIPNSWGLRTYNNDYARADGFTRKFTGKERDAETELDYFGKRYYGSALGRWTSPDPKGLALRHLLNPQKLNMYSYVLNNPMSAFDPEGMEEVTITYRAFIPTPSVTAALKTYGGDNRGFSTANASSRTSISIRIETDPSIRPGNPIISVDRHAGQSTRIKNGQVVETATATKGLPTATGTRDANGTPIINIQQDTKLPLSPGPSALTPGISANLNVMVYQDASTTQVNGTAAQFPASELNVTRADGTTTPVIQFMPPPDASPWSLLKRDRDVDVKKETPACHGGDKGCPQ